MKVAAKLTALGLTAAMMLSMTSCAFLGGSKIGINKVMNYANDEGAEIYDDAKKYSKLDRDDAEDGIAIQLEGKDIKKVFSADNFCILPVLDDFYSNGMTQAACYQKVKDNTNGGNAIYVFSVVFEEEDDAEDYFDDIHDGIQPNGTIEADNDDGEEDGIGYTVMNVQDETSGNSAAVGAYRDGNTVLVIISYGYQSNKTLKIADEVCDYFGVHQISDT